MALYGIYGSHTPETCPWNNVEIRKGVLDAASRFENPEGFAKYKINKVVGQYHSALEHTFLWIVDAEDPHLIQQFAVDSGMARFNFLKFVPLITFKEVVEGCRKLGV
ncbi:MAG: hypothetical protein ACE5KA_00015 [Nitrososphaerales archaeon]